MAEIIITIQTHLYHRADLSKLFGISTGTECPPAQVKIYDPKEIIVIDELLNANGFIVRQCPECNRQIQILPANIQRID